MLHTIANVVGGTTGATIKDLSCLPAEGLAVNLLLLASAETATTPAVPHDGSAGAPEVLWSRPGKEPTKRDYYDGEREWCLRHASPGRLSPEHMDGVYLYSVWFVASSGTRTCVASRIVEGRF